MLAVGTELPHLSLLLRGLGIFCAIEPPGLMGFMDRRGPLDEKEISVGVISAQFYP